MIKERSPFEPINHLIWSFFSNPCQNEGKCTDIGLNAFNCTCQIGWEGLTCTKDVDDCLRNPCDNDGECSDFGTNSFNCECKDGWSGKTCTLQTKSGNSLISNLIWIIIKTIID